MRMIVRKIALIGVVTTALLGVLPAALAGSGSGNIKVGHPGVLARGVTEGEFRVSCSSIPQTQGTDGWIVDLAGGTHLNLTTASSAPHSVVVLFLDSRCSKVGPLYGSAGSTSYVGTIPSLNGIYARWAVVNAVYGANINVNFNVTAP